MDVVAELKQERFESEDLKILFKVLRSMDDGLVKKVELTQDGSRILVTHGPEFFDRVGEFYDKMPNISYHHGLHRYLDEDIVVMEMTLTN